MFNSQSMFKLLDRSPPDKLPRPVILYTSQKFDKNINRYGLYNSKKDIITINTLKSKHQQTFTLCHQLIHSTLHNERLNRKSMRLTEVEEELVAHISTMFIMKQLDDKLFWKTYLSNTDYIRKITENKESKRIGWVMIYRAIKYFQTNKDPNLISEFNKFKTILSNYFKMNNYNISNLVGKS